MIYDLNFIGSTIKLEREKIGITQTKLANISGVSRATINALENFKAQDVSVNTLSMILKSLEPDLSNNSISENKLNVFASKLEFPYVWSSKNPSDELIIRKVLERLMFKDIVNLCIYYGVLKVSSTLYSSKLKDDSLLMKSLIRMLGNIQKGLSHA